MAAKIPREGTARRRLYDMLNERPGEWIEFDPRDFDIPSANRAGLHLRELREQYELDIRADGRGRPGICRWRYVPSDSHV